MSPGDEKDFSGLKVMVIDDSKTIRRTAETLLSKAGCEVLTATDGFEALALIADHRPDLIFVDIMMPRLDGYQTCALIKHNDMFNHIPVRTGYLIAPAAELSGRSNTLPSLSPRKNC